MSKEELRLPGVLPDLAGLTELTLARGSFRVVTDATGSSCTRGSIVAPTSVAVKVEGRLACFELEKKRGDWGPGLDGIAPGIGRDRNL